MKRILSYLRDYRRESILAPLFKMLEALLELFVPLVVSAIIDVGIAHKDMPFIIRMCLLMVLLAVIGLVCSITAQYFAARAAVGAATGLRHSLFAHIQSLTFTEMDTVGASTLITRMTSDINQVQNGINLVLRLFMRSPFIVFGAMIMAFTIDTEAALIFAAVIPLLSAVVFGIMIITRPLYKKVQSGLDRIMEITRGNLTGVRVIRAFNKEDEEKREFTESNDRLAAYQKFVGKISGLLNPMTYILINAAVIVLIQVGAIKVNAGDLTQGQVVALYNYMSQILVELIKLANLIVTITKALACEKRIDEVFGIAPSMIEGPQEGIPKYPSAVEFRNVSLRYKNAGDNSLSDISFTVRTGQTVGIIGGTGAGKTSLVNLIPRFYDATEGQVFLFGCDIREYSFEALRNNIAVVLQRAQLFRGSIRDNITLGKMEIPDDALSEALNISQAQEFVSGKEGGLDAKIEQSGKNLSGGQKQRLTIARALVKKPRILILDDSASALDYATDLKLRKGLQALSYSPTVFIISQRASSILHADLILVLDDGRLVGAGSHSQLLESCEVYREIYSSQYQGGTRHEA